MKRSDLHPFAPGAFALLPGLVWHQAERTIAVYPGLLEPPDQLVALAIRALPPFNVLRSFWRVVTCLFPHEASQCERLAYMVPYGSGEVYNAKTRWRVGSSTPAPVNLEETGCDPRFRLAQPYRAIREKLCRPRPDRRG